MSSVRDAITDLPEPAPNYLIYHDGAAYILKNTTTKAVASNTSEAGVLFNIAIDDLTTNVGSIHFHGELNISTKVLKTNVMITGDGPLASILKLSDSQDKEVIESDNFESLTCTETEGGPYLVILIDFGNQNIYVYNCKYNCKLMEYIQNFPCRLDVPVHSRVWKIIGLMFKVCGMMDMA